MKTEGIGKKTFDEVGKGKKNFGQIFINHKKMGQFEFKIQVSYIDFWGAF